MVGGWCVTWLVVMVVQIEIETADKTGTFLGSLWEGKENVSVALLEAGLAKLHPSFSTDRVTEGHLLVRAEESAKKKKLKVGGVCVWCGMGVGC